MSPRARSPRAGAAPNDLAVRIGPLTLANPVLVASGTFGYGEELAHALDLSALGAVITKTVTLQPRAGNRPARVVETPSGMLNSIGLENVGAAAFARDKLPRLRALGVTIVASIGGETPAELERLLARLSGERGIAAFEINFSCPNVAAGGARYWAQPRRLERTLARLRKVARVPLVAKLGPDVTSVADLARACEQGGAHALTAVNTFVGMSVDLTGPRSRLGRRTGGVSGPAIRPLALARCDEVVRAVRIPVIGSGGIVTAADALEFLAVGAAAVQVGTATFIRPAAAGELLAGLRAFLRERGTTLAAWRGSFRDGEAGARTGNGAARRTRTCTRPPRAARPRAARFRGAVGADARVRP